ncbi:unnamed protein product [Calypogeia fissa]
MRGTVYQRLPSMGKGAARRSWTIFCFILSVVLLAASPWLYPELVSRIYDSQISARHRCPGLVSNSAGPNLTYEEFQRSGSHHYSSSLELINNPFGPDFTFEQAEGILACLKTSQSSTSLPLGDPLLPPNECPSYFQLIHTDLEPWKETGITLGMIEMAKPFASFRIVILDGKLYVEDYYECIMHRQLYTVWGLLLFLEKFRGQVPDLEFVVNCGDVPLITKGGSADVIFAYNSNHGYYDIPFPDWSFWGWADLFLTSWDEERETIINGSQRMDWKAKVPKAYWTGNPYVGCPHRVELVECHGEGSTEIRPVDWDQEWATGGPDSRLEDQCNHKYMIYTEGNGWSVSLKYIMSCGSPTLSIKPSWYDFFSRGLQQWVHYIPVRPSRLLAPEMCDSLNKAVEWAEANQGEAVRIGAAGREFVRSELSMENVYNYMFHLLREYAQLLKFKPIQGAASLVTLDQVLCLVEPGLHMDTLRQTMKAMPINPLPCKMSDSEENQLVEPDWESW